MPNGILKPYFKETWKIYVSSITLHAAASIIYACFPKVLGYFTDRLQTGDVIRDDVTFGYKSEPPVFSGLDLHIRPGESSMMYRGELSRLTVKIFVGLSVLFSKNLICMQAVLLITSECSTIRSAV